MTIKCPMCKRGLRPVRYGKYIICEECGGSGEIETYSSFQTEPTPVDAPGSDHGPGPGIRPPTKDVED